MYDIRLVDGKVSIAIDGCVPIHHVDFLTGQRIVLENLPLVLQQRVAIEKAIMHLFSAHMQLCLALRGKNAQEIPSATTEGTGEQSIPIQGGTNETGRIVGLGSERHEDHDHGRAECDKRGQGEGRIGVSHNA